MIYKFYGTSTGNIIKHIEYILPEIGNIQEFEVFRDEKDTKYQSTEDNKTLKYTFILKDDNNNEFWFNTLCGYNGDSPNATIKILQLLGIKQDFNICEQGVNHIKQKNLSYTHKFNILIAKQKPINVSKNQREYLFMVTIDFKYAYQKNNFYNSLSLLGEMQPITIQNKQGFEESNLFTGLSYPAFELRYYTNYIFTFNYKFKDFISNQIEIIVESLAQNSGGEFCEKFDI